MRQPSQLKKKTWHVQLQYCASQLTTTQLRRLQCPVSQPSQPMMSQSWASPTVATNQIVSVAKLSIATIAAVATDHAPVAKLSIATVATDEVGSVAKPISQPSQPSQPVNYWSVDLSGIIWKEGGAGLLLVQIRWRQKSFSFICHIFFFFFFFFFFFCFYVEFLQKWRTSRSTLISMRLLTNEKLIDVRRCVGWRARPRMCSICRWGRNCDL